MDILIWCYGNKQGMLGKKGKRIQFSFLREKKYIKSWPLCLEEQNFLFRDFRSLGLIDYTQKELCFRYRKLLSNPFSCTFLFSFFSFLLISHCCLFKSFLYKEVSSENTYYMYVLLKWKPSFALCFQLVAIEWKCFCFFLRFRFTANESESLPVDNTLFPHHVLPIYTTFSLSVSLPFLRCEPGPDL